MKYADEHPKPIQKTLLGVFTAPGTLNIASYYPNDYQSLTEEDFIYVINEDISMGTYNRDSFNSAGWYDIYGNMAVTLPKISYDNETGILTYSPVYAYSQVAISSVYNHKADGYKDTTFYILR